MSIDNYSYGLEIEAVDFRRDLIDLPDGCSWSKKETTLVNSNGLAVDTTAKSKNMLGGEINTKPTIGIGRQVIVAQKCLKLLKGQDANINYRCNLQTHVGNFYDPDDEKDTLHKLKVLQQYAFDHYDKFMMMTMGPGQFTKRPEFSRAFWAHYRERMVKQWKHDLIMSVESLAEYRVSLCYTKNRVVVPLSYTRQGINIHKFFFTGTVEFRIFWATLDIKDIRIMLEFSKVFMDDALGKQDSANDIIEYFTGKFPPELPFIPELEEGYEKTKVPKPI